MSVSISEARKRFENAGIERSDRYEKGTEGKGSAWAGSKARAKTNFQPAMQEVLSKDLYGKGLDRADANDYDRGIQDKGIQNWGTGMSAGGTKWEERVKPFETLWNQSLPTAPGQKRSAANMKRMTENVQRFISAAGK